MDQSGTPSSKATSPVVWIVLVVVVLALAGGVFYVVSSDQGNANNANLSNSNTLAQNTNVNADTSGWLTYSSDTMGVSTVYPPDWTPVEATDTKGVYFHRADIGGGLDAAATGIGIRIFDSLQQLPNVGSTTTLRDWVTDNAASEPNSCDLFGLHGFESFWPSAITTYSFILARENEGVIKIDIDYSGMREVSPKNGRPMFTPEEAEILRNLVVS